jgi:hypothetical protein
MPPASPIARRPSPGVARLGAALWAFAFVALALYLVSYLAHVAVLARYPYAIDQGEGYDVNSGWLLAQGRPIYNDNSRYPYYSSNYPLVFSLLLAPIVAQAGPTLGGGRLLSAGAALLTAAAIGLILWREQRAGLAALTAGLLYIGSSYVYHVTPLARVNALAALFALIGVFCCSRRGRGWVAAAVIAFLLALYTKPTTVDAVAAGLLFLFLRDRRTGLVAAGALVVVGGLLWLALDLTHGGQFFVNVFVGNVNPFSVSQAIGYFRNFLETHAGLLVLAAWWLWRSWRRGQFGPFEIYWVFALVLAVSVGKWGAGESYFLAPIVASCVLAGRALASALRIAPRRPFALAAVGAALLLQSTVALHGPMADVLPWFGDRGAQAATLGRWPSPEDRATGDELVAQLQRHDAPVLAEDPSFSLAAGREVVGNATHLRNLHESGFWRPDSLVADLDARRFSSVVLDAQLYPEPVLAAIGRDYYLYEEYAIRDTRQQLFAPGAE